MKKKQDSPVPILRSYAIVRSEFFGGFVLNYFSPPELRLDHVRFEIALMCNGAYTKKEMEDRLGGELNHSREYINTLVENTLSLLDERGLLYWRTKKLKEPRDTGTSPEPRDGSRRTLSAPLAVIWEITRRCNLKCKHCFSSAGHSEHDELTTDEVKRVIDLLEKRKVFYINFTGGEPLLRKDLSDILHYASGKKLSINLSTNGCLVTRQVAEMLQDTNIFEVQISVDGMHDHHDSFRGVRGSFRRAVEAITLLRDAEINVVISTTVNKTNMDQIPAIIDLALDAGASAFKTTLFIPVGRGESHQRELVLTNNDVYRLARLMREKKEDARDRMVLEFNSCYSWLFEESRRAAPSRIVQRTIGCAGGNTNICITANGRVLPCPFLRDPEMGDIRRDNFDEIWNSGTTGPLRNLQPENLKGKCHSCRYLGGECYGGCRAAALAYTGDLLGEDPFCWKDIVQQHA